MHLRYCKQIKHDIDNSIISIITNGIIVFKIQLCYGNVLYIRKRNEEFNILYKRTTNNIVSTVLYANRKGTNSSTEDSMLAQYEYIITPENGDVRCVCNIFEHKNICVRLQMDIANAAQMNIIVIDITEFYEDILDKNTDNLNTLIKLTKKSSLSIRDDGIRYQSNHKNYTFYYENGNPEILQIFDVSGLRAIKNGIDCAVNDKAFRNVTTICKFTECTSLIDEKRKSNELKKLHETIKNQRKQIHDQLRLINAQQTNLRNLKHRHDKVAQSHSDSSNHWIDILYIVLLLMIFIIVIAITIRMLRGVDDLNLISNADLDAFII